MNSSVSVTKLCVCSGGGWLGGGFYHDVHPGNYLNL